jgi:hypothetical protein
MEMKKHEFSNEADGGNSNSKSYHKPEHKLFRKAFDWAKTKRSDSKSTQTDAVSSGIM